MGGRFVRAFWLEGSASSGRRRQARPAWACGRCCRDARALAIWLPLRRQPKLHALPIRSGGLLVEHDRREKPGRDELSTEFRRLRRIRHDAAKRHFAAAIDGDRVQTRTARRRIGQHNQRVEERRLVLLQILEKAQLTIDAWNTVARGFDFS
jgi:hypothetical protein